MVVKYGTTSRGSMVLDRIEQEVKRSGRITVALNIRRWILRSLIKSDKTRPSVINALTPFLKVSKREVSSAFSSIRRAGLITPK